MQVINPSEDSQSPTFRITPLEVVRLMRDRFPKAEPYKSVLDDAEQWLIAHPEANSV